MINSIEFGSLIGQSKLGNNESQVQNNGFLNLFEESWELAKGTQEDLAKKQYLQSIGEIDDTHTVPLAASQAELSLTMLVNLRNKALDSYNELMRMSI